MAVEVAGKHAYLAYFRKRHENDAEGLRKALDVLEIRIVYEEIGEKIAIFVAPFVVTRLDPGRSAMRLAGFAALLFAIEEVVDVVLVIVMARYEVNALRVKPKASRVFVQYLCFGMCWIFATIVLSVKVL